MITDNTQDWFICGKCQLSSSDLNTFLTHRLTCNGPQTTSLFSVSSSLPSVVLEDELSDIFQDVPLDIPSTLNLYFEPARTVVSSKNEFDLLFDQLIEQDAISDEVIRPNNTEATEYSSFENGTSTTSVSECPVCDEQFDAPAVLENHVFEHSTWIDENENRNSKSGLAFGDSSSSHTNLLDELTTTAIKCEQCTITIASNRSLNIHNKITHSFNPVFRCLDEACSQLFDKPFDYILHARIHRQKGHIGSLRSSHNNVYHRRYTCKHRCGICKQSFQNSEQLQYHMRYRTHKFFCHSCPAEFESNNSYHNHLAKHPDVALYRCTVCVQSFQKRHNLSRHVITQHNKDLPNQKSCSPCKLTFKTTFHLNRHNTTKHSDVKPFVCDQNECGQVFARKDKLKEHAAKHSASGGLFQCRTCVKTFVRRENLRNHNIVRHSKQYPFRCDLCEQGFLHPNQLYAHHKQRHSVKNQKISENEEVFAYDQTQREQDFSNNPIDSLLSV